MGLGRLLHQRQRVETRAAGAGFQVVIDGNPVGYPTSIYRGAMGIPAAWRAALLISDLLGAVPWHAFRERAGAPVEKLDPTPLLLEQPSPPDTRMTTMSSLALDLVWHGNAVQVIAARDRAGWPTATVPVPAEQVGVRRVRESDISPLSAGEVEYKIGGESYRADEVIHIKGPCPPGGLRGFGVLEAHLDGTLNLSQEQAKQAASISRHGVPTGKLKVSNPDATEDDLKKVKAGWLQAQRDRSVAVLNATTDFEPLSWNPDELQLVDSRKFAIHEIALIFGLPLSFLGADQSSRTYSNIEQESINLIKFSLGGHLARFEQTLTAHLPRGTWAQANLDAILRGDTLTRYQAHGIAIDKGFLTVDEVRKLEDLPPLPDQEHDEDNTPAGPGEEEQ